MITYSFCYTQSLKTHAGMPSDTSNELMYQFFAFDVLRHSKVKVFADGELQLQFQHSLAEEAEKWENKKIERLVFQTSGGMLSVQTIVKGRAGKINLI